MTRKNADAASDRPADSHTDAPSGWTRPRLVKLEPGTASHERAKVAFDLLRAAKGDSGTGNKGSR